jgi:valyl-tRNA synthetase
MSKEFAKGYSPKEVEKKWYDLWQTNQIYKSQDKTEKPTYSVLMPPPNVTGILHFGHVLNNSIQDVYIRWKRMSGYEVCWFPGIDHAGIATQSRVEKELKAEGLTRYDLGREKFLEKVWEWKNKYGNIIFEQLRYLGISCDWSRTIFTMEENPSKAVKHVFIKLFDDGLIYKGKRIINWSPLAQTALSDEEVEFREVKEHLFTLRYKFVDSDEYLKVATVRPETIFGDVAIAVNPEDERYKDKIGSFVLVPFVGTKIPIIADEYADPKFGTGCVKITPAHDPNDFEVGTRHNLEMPNTINPDGTLNELTGEFNGIERFKARKIMLEKLKELDLIEKIEDYTHNVGFSQRGGEPIEPYLSDQWFVKMKPLAEIALKPVVDGEIKFYPSHWTKTYEHWMNNIRDWCISRQLWWGHRIPVYYTPDGQFTAAENESEARLKLNCGNEIELTQDSDVLDTWFSSWLWPMTTMEWLKNGEDTNDILETYSPTSLMVTAPDIIFFWVARMIMASVKFKNVIPFKDVYFTSLIRDGQGRKLSKSLGNSPDPLIIVDKYGADAVRFTMLFLSPLGQDVRMEVNVESQDIPSMEIGRNFANKVWNAGRFLMMKKEGIENLRLEKTMNLNSDFEGSTFADKWIYSRFQSTLKLATQALDNYKLNDYSKIIYDFIWRDFCDWYVEIFKIEFNNAETDLIRKNLVEFALSLYSNIIKILHPVMPFITEEIYHILFDLDDNISLSLEEFPKLNNDFLDENIEQEFELLQMLIDEIRKLRSGLNIPPSEKIDLIVSAKDSKQLEFLNAQKDIISNLARCSSFELGENLAKPDKSIASVIREIQIFILPSQNIDLDKEKERLNKEIERLQRNIDGSEKKLSNEGFVSKAPANILLAEREKLESMRESLKKVIENLENLS